MVVKKNVSQRSRIFLVFIDPTMFKILSLSIMEKKNSSTCKNFRRLSQGPSENTEKFYLELDIDLEINPNNRKPLLFENDKLKQVNQRLQLVGSTFELKSAQHFAFGFAGLSFGQFIDEGNFAGVFVRSCSLFDVILQFLDQFVISFITFA